MKSWLNIAAYCEYLIIFLEQRACLAAPYRKAATLDLMEATFTASIGSRAILENASQRHAVFIHGMAVLGSGRAKGFEHLSCGFYTDQDSVCSRSAKHRLGIRSALALAKGLTSPRQPTGLRAFCFCSPGASFPSRRLTGC